MKAMLPGRVFILPADITEILENTSSKPIISATSNDEELASRLEKATGTSEGIASTYSLSMSVSASKTSLEHDVEHDVDHFRFISYAPPCQYHSLSHTFLKQYSSLEMINDGNADTTCALMCLDEDHCQAFSVRDENLCTFYMINFYSTQEEPSKGWQKDFCYFRVL